jgi:hypothetical protein
MPNRRVKSNLIAVVNDFNITISHRVNYKVHEKNPDKEELVFDFGTSIELVAEILQPKEQKGYQLKLELHGVNLNEAKMQSKLEDWRNWTSKNQDNMYIPPLSIGNIGRSRKKVLDGFLYLPKSIVSDILATLQIDKKLYIEIIAEKTNGSRFIHDLSIQHSEPESE